MRRSAISTRVEQLLHPLTLEDKTLEADLSALSTYHHGLSAEGCFGGRNWRPGWRDGAFSVFLGSKVGVSGLLTGKTLTLALALRVQRTLPRLPLCASTIHCCFTRNSYAQTIDHSSADFLPRVSASSSAR